MSALKSLFEDYEDIFPQTNTGVGENWLLVFGNIMSPSDITDLWPHSGNGAVLLTTQDTSWLSQEYISHGIRLEPFTSAEGINLVTSLYERNNRKIPERDAVCLVEETGGLPLAICQICSFVLAEDWGLNDFLHSY